jgi:hypothetical protein
MWPFFRTVLYHRRENNYTVEQKIRQPRVNSVTKGVACGLDLPRILCWNFTVEQSVGARRTELSYRPARAHIRKPSWLHNEPLSLQKPISWSTISLRFLGIILRFLGLEVSIYNVYITNQCLVTFAQNSLVEVTVNGKQENPEDMCIRVQWFWLFSHFEV